MENWETVSLPIILVMYYIKASIFNELINTIGNAPIESGGIIGVKENIICSYYFDKQNISHDAEYQPNCRKLNVVIENWKRKGIEFIGIAHSDPNSYNKPSLTDYIYAKQLMHENKFLKKLLFPIITKTKNTTIVTFYEFVDDFCMIEVDLIN